VTVTCHVCNFSIFSIFFLCFSETALQSDICHLSHAILAFLGFLGFVVTVWHPLVTYLLLPFLAFFIREKGGSKQELNSSVTSCDKARRGGIIIDNIALT
jgi:hypothetical protein